MKTYLSAAVAAMTLLLVPLETHTQWGSSDQDACDSACCDAAAGCDMASACDAAMAVLRFLWSLRAVRQRLWLSWENEVVWLPEAE